VHRISIAFVPFILAVSTASVPVFALDHRDTRTAGLCEVGSCMAYRSSSLRDDCNALTRVTTSDPLGMGGVIDFNSTRVGSACTAMWWPAAELRAAKFDGTMRRQIRPGASLQRVVADTGKPRDFPEGPVAGVHKLENVPIVRDDAGKAPSGQGRSDSTDGVENHRQDTRLSLPQDAPRSVPGTTLTRNESRQEQWMRVPDRAMPEPGTWAVLIAGLLGICAVARPRIFSS
jgi:hypothetical protein